jgi:hypothetical protein
VAERRPAGIRIRNLVEVLVRVGHGVG